GCRHELLCFGNVLLEVLRVRPEFLALGVEPPTTARVGVGCSYGRVPAPLDRQALGFELVAVEEAIDPEVAVPRHRHRLAHPFVAERGRLPAEEGADAGRSHA